jgi:hypothetical protein
LKKERKGEYRPSQALPFPKKDFTLDQIVEDEGADDYLNDS